MPSLRFPQPRTILMTAFAAFSFIVLSSLLVYLRVLPGRNPPTPLSGTVSFWAVNEDFEVWRGAIQQFQEQHPFIHIRHVRINEGGYEEQLVNSIAAGTGPDVFMLGNDMVAKHRDKIAPFPQVEFQFPARNFATTFTDGVAEELITEDNDILGFPLYVDTPILMYNKDITNAAGVAVIPTTWEDLIPLSRKFTIKTAVGDIVKSGLPIGTYANVDHAFEILSSLFMQYGDPIVSRAPEPRVSLLVNVDKVLKFFTSFADPGSENFTWTARMPFSLDTFARGDAAFVLGYSTDLEKIKALSPHLNIGVAPFPQPKEVRTPVVYQKFYFPTVSRASQQQAAAWLFVSFITREKGAETYLAKTKRTPARRDLIARPAKTAGEDILLRQALIAKGWHIPHSQAARRIFADAIDSIITRVRTPGEAMQFMRDRMDLLVP